MPAPALRLVLAAALAVLGALAALAALAAPAPAATTQMPRISAHDGRLWAGERPFKALGLNWGIGAREPALRFFDEPTDAALAELTEQMRIARSLGVNSLRMYLEVFQVMDGPTRARPSALRALRRLLAAAEREGIYLDITGNLTWRPAQSPRWYERLDEHRRWQVQARFWSAVARAAAPSPAVLCYELTSEPIVALEPEDGRYHGLFGGYSFVQSIGARRGPLAMRMARSWTRLLGAAVRRVDDRPVTIGLLGTLGGPFQPANVADLLDLLVLHEYPTAGRAEESIALVRHFASLGKPAVLGETFMLSSDEATQRTFLRESAPHLAGVFGFFDGRHPDEIEIRDIGDALVVGSLRQIVALGPQLTGA